MANLDINFAEFERIYPTENDIAFSPYNGVNGSEVNYSKNLQWRRPKNCILANLDGFGNPDVSAGFVCSDGGGVIVNITRGRAYIEGRYVELNAGGSFAVTVDADKDTYIYLQLNISGSVQITPPARFITVSVAHNLPHSRPANAVPIAKIVTNGTPIITSITDLRPSQFKDCCHVSIPFGGAPNPKGFVRVPSYNGEYAYLTGYLYGWVSALVGIGTLTINAVGPNGNFAEVQTLPTFVATGTGGVKRFRVGITISTNIGRYDNDFVELNLIKSAPAVLNVGTEQMTTVLPEIGGMWAWQEWNAKG
jgi:hypothetical protein